MSLITILFNGKNISVSPQESLLQIAHNEGINIPTLCHDPRLEPASSCFLCVVEVKGARTLQPACSTFPFNGMEVETDSEKVLQARKTALELLLSDHYGDCYGPCKLACPAHADVQGYVGLTAQGRYRDALILLKERLPFPSSIGRVCPGFCEVECRRQHVEDPIAIRQIKRFVGDTDLFGESPYTPDILSANGKKVAVIGGGPAGLTAAYYLARKGTEVTILEAREKLGGMLRYGIPVYRLPKDILDKEIETVLIPGIHVEYNKVLGKDFSLSDLQKEGYDGIIVATGAWSTRKLGIPGEDNSGICDGIKYLEELNKTGTYPISGRVAVIGGGNTAFDCARSALRLGAREVVMVYRRTREEMPANDIEIEEAIEEGIQFKLLTAPHSVKEIDNRLLLTCQQMELGEPDSSGRRRPVPIEGALVEEQFDYILTAIGQLPDYLPLGEEKRELLSGQKWIPYDEKTGLTSLQNIFIAGDFATGPKTVVEAVASARFAVEALLKQFTGLPVIPKIEFPSARPELDQPTHPYYSTLKREERVHPSILSPGKRASSLEEIESCFTEEEAGTEAARCLECGCMDIHQCSLKKYADLYEATQQHYQGEMRNDTCDDSHDLIVRDPGKCILCGRCISLCDNFVGPGVYGFIGRGFETRVNPVFSSPLMHSDCIACGACISGCPVGAIVPREPGKKMVPLQGKLLLSSCTGCSLGCDIMIDFLHDSIREVREVNNFLCKRGRFNYPEKPGMEESIDDFLSQFSNFTADAIVPSPSLSAEDYLAVKNLSQKFKIPLFNYYRQSSLCVAFSENDTFPRMDFFTSSPEENDCVVLASPYGDSESSIIPEITSRIKNGGDFYFLGKAPSFRLSHGRVIGSLDEIATISSYKRVFFLIDPVLFDREYGWDASLKLYNDIVGSSNELHTTLLSRSGNLYSLLDAASASTDSFSEFKKVLYIGGIPLQLKNDDIMYTAGITGSQNLSGGSFLFSRFDGIKEIVSMKRESLFHNILEEKGIIPLVKVEKKITFSRDEKHLAVKASLWNDFPQYENDSSS